MAAEVAKSGFSVVFELPGHERIQTSEQYKAMTNSNGVKVTTFDGCCFGHRVTMSSQVSYVNSNGRCCHGGLT